MAAHQAKRMDNALNKVVFQKLFVIASIGREDEEEKAA